jgi:hypothetical protein
MRVNGFVFNGSIDGLKAQLSGYFPMRVFFGHNLINADLEAQQVRINIKGEMSLRELLLKIAAEAKRNVSVIYTLLPAGDAEDETSQKIVEVYLGINSAAPRASE